MAMRKALQEVIPLIKRHLSNVEGSSSELQRAFSSLPDDIFSASRRAKFPARLNNINAIPHVVNNTAEPIVDANSSSAVTDSVKEGAKIASAWMLPWERRQMEGSGGLRTWEKIYWGVFVVAISVFLFNKARDWGPAPEPEVDESKELRKEEFARVIAAGGTALVPWGDEDPFDGMSPDEVQEYVATVTGSKDPYEGMDPKEIDALIRRQGAKSAFSFQ